MAPKRKNTFSTSHAPPPRLIVTGATGKQGSAVINALVASDHPFDIYAVTRDTYSDAAKVLEKKPDVRVIEGTFDKPEEIFEQADNVWGVFIMSTPMGKGGAVLEEEQGKKMVKAALKAGVKHIVYTSVDRGVNGETDGTSIPHFQSKKNVEDYIKAETEGTSTTWTFLRPVAFMENVSNDFIGKTFVTMWQQNGLDRKLQLISSKDVGRVAADVFLKIQADPSAADYKNKAISLAAESITPTKAAQSFKEVTGQDLPYTFSVVGLGFKWMLPNEVGKMFAWFKDVGYGADVDALRKRYPFLMDFKTWVEEESAWKKAQEQVEEEEELESWQK